MNKCINKSILISSIFCNLYCCFYFQEDIGKAMVKDIKFAFTCSSSVKEVPRSKKKLRNSQSTMSDVNEIRYGIYNQ